MKGHALLIGVDYLEDKHYIKKHPLKSVSKNLDLVNSILDKTNLYPSANRIPLREKEANWTRVQGELSKLNKLPANDFVVIYLSCHGAKIDLVDDSDYEEKNFFCLYDKMVFENEWKYELSKINSNINIFVVIDSCYSTSSHKARPESPFKRVYTNNPVKYSKLNSDFPNDQLRNLTDFCLLYSSETPSGVGPLVTDPSYFTNQLYAYWNSDGANLNYLDFREKILKLKFDKDKIPDLKIVEKKIGQKTIFHSTPLFNFMKPIPQLKATTTKVTKSMMPSEIGITEKEDENISVHMNPVHPNFYYTHSYTWDLDNQSSNPNLQALMLELLSINQSILSDIEFIGVMFVNLNNQGTRFPIITNPDSIPVNSMYCIEESTSQEENGNGLVVICASDSANRVIYHKRTRGKVSNSIGR